MMNHIRSLPYHSNSICLFEKHSGLFFKSALKVALSETGENN